MNLTERLNGTGTKKINEKEALAKFLKKEEDKLLKIVKDEEQALRTRKLNTLDSDIIRLNAELDKVLSPNDKINPVKAVVVIASVASIALYTVSPVFGVIGVIGLFGALSKKSERKTRKAQKAQSKITDSKIREIKGKITDCNLYKNRIIRLEKLNQ